jgi:Holliday junction resolvase-like predicted endonuclease
MKTSWQVVTAAEAFAAAQFARCGWDVSVQYGANQPEYDLVAVDGDRVLKISVKGSKSGSWGLVQSYLKKADYHGAIRAWLARHTGRTIFCLVQFRGTATDELPRMYLMTPKEIADQLRKSAGGRGATRLCEKHTWGPRAQAAGTTDEIPSTWRFSEERIVEVQRMSDPGASVTPLRGTAKPRR